MRSTSSAVHVTARFGSASRGDPLYEVVVRLGRLLRTVFLCHYFVNDTFRCELLRILNCGEAVNALKRAIYIGRVASHQAKRPDEMQAVADALSLLANILMAWNTAQMQQVLDHWAQRRGGAVPPELIGRVAPPVPRALTFAASSGSPSSDMPTRSYRPPVPRK